MLQAAAAVSRSSYLQADGAQLPFRPAGFDSLLCVATIPYLPDLAKAVTEWCRVAQPGADLVFTTPPPTASPPYARFGPDAWPSRVRDQLVAETEDLDAAGVKNCGFDQVDLRSDTRNPAAFSRRAG
jgi:ubiquinone/menaquinone biosynthesis C-methylase UbiE